MSTVDDLRNQLADRLDEHPFPEWSAGLLQAVIGVLDLHAAIGGTKRAPVLELVRG